MDTNPAISLIFVNYQSARYLEAALESLFSFEREGVVFEVIVVNNDPSENAFLQSLKQTFHFILIESAENGGFSRASNLGAKQAQGTILGFINPDVLWKGVYLKKITDFFEKERRVGVLGMTLLDIKGKREIWSVGKEPSLSTLFLNKFSLLRQTITSQEEYFFSDWVSGGALFIRKELFIKVEGFDERFFLYFEDVDLCKKVRQLGFLVACHTNFCLTHFGGKSQKSEHFQKKYYFFSQREFFRKHRPRWEGNVLEFLQFLFRKG